MLMPICCVVRINNLIFHGGIVVWNANPQNYRNGFKALTLKIRVGSKYQLRKVALRFVWKKTSQNITYFTERYKIVCLIFSGLLILL
jgi:hypothetical protein